MGWKSVPQFPAEKRNDLAPDDFTCGKTKDCTLCLVEMGCRSLTIGNSILRYLGANLCTTRYTLQRKNVRHVPRQESNLAVYIWQSQRAI